jgi:hypothetical protein
MAVLHSLAELLKAPRGLAEGSAQLLHAHGGLAGVEDLGQVAQQAFDEPLQGVHIGQPLAFGAFAKLLVPGLALPFIQRLEEEVWLLEHAFALYAIGPLVMVEPSQERAGRWRLLAYRIEQDAGTSLVGARQRQQDSVGGLAGDLPRAYRLVKGLGQRTEQGQATAYPTFVFAQSRGDRLPREPLVHQARQ